MFVILTSVHVTFSVR